MRYMGIDFGTKRIGIALSDETAHFAMPQGILANTAAVFDDMRKIIDTQEVGNIVIGESKDFKGNDNKVMAKVREFKKKLEDVFQLPVFYEPEFLTSHQAEKIQGKTSLLDASAAALILQSYLDRLNSTLENK